MASKDIDTAPEEAHLTIAAGPLETIEPHTSALSCAIAAASLVIGDANTFDLWRAMTSEFEAEKTLPPAEVQEWLRARTPGWVIGHGPAEWMARELSLKCLELGGALLRSSSSEAFFHGFSQFLPERKDQPLRILHLNFGEDPRDAEWRETYTPNGAKIVSWDLRSGGEREYMLARAIFKVQRAALEATRA